MIQRRMDLFDRLRHWLIRRLACGDMVVLNVELAFGAWRRRNAGPALLANVRVRLPQDRTEFRCGMSFDGYPAVLALSSYGMRELSLRDVTVELVPPPVEGDPCREDGR